MSLEAWGDEGWGEQNGPVRRAPASTVTPEMIEAGRKAIAGERARIGGKTQYPDTLAIIAYEAMAPLAPSAEASLGLVTECWRELCEKDDRTSNHPTMCLISDVELRDFMDRAILSVTATR